MSDRAAYLDYIADDAFAEGYLEYQGKYTDVPRESDRRLIELIDRALPGRDGGAVLDLGCSTGNLLRHLRRARPDLHLTGGELLPSHLESCQRDPELVGVNFARIDALDIGRQESFDVIVMNAVLYLFELPQLKSALANVARALRPGGTFAVFDLFHPFGQELAITETSATHLEGLTLHFRPYDTIRDALDEVGLSETEIRPFRIPIDLPRPARDDDIISYTVPTDDGERLLFRGALFQPWCHVTARRP